MRELKDILEDEGESLEAKFKQWSDNQNELENTNNTPTFFNRLLKSKTKQTVGSDIPNIIALIHGLKNSYDFPSSQISVKPAF